MNTLAYERGSESDAGLAGTLAADGQTITMGASTHGGIVIPDEVRRAAERPSHTTTVLPRVEAGDDGTLRLSYASRKRYEATHVLGEGGMGTVALALDHDIDRKVALKQIRPEVQGGSGLARFAEEVRTIGRLEHPNIIPIHDVGVDESGQYFFVMKYVEGETLETAIERLADGDPEAHARYTFEVRAQIMLGLLRALAYAHDRGIVHRDVKPANIMVGPYGEVVLMDWGIARPIDGHDFAASLPGASEASPTEGKGATKKRLVQTAHAQVVGTPAYMSPEQARGESDIDARTDLYSATVVFHEFLTLRHYLDDKETLPAMIAAILAQPPPKVGLGYHQEGFGSVPSEYAHFSYRGLQKERGARWQSAQQMITELEDALEGKVRVQCTATMTKRMARESGRFVDRHPHLAFGAFIWMTMAVLASLVAIVVAGIVAAT